MKNKNLLFIITLFLILLSCKSQQQTSYSVDGKFVGKGKAGSKLELILTDDNKFQYWERFGHGSEYTDGTWELENDLMILNSRTLTKDEELMHAISSAKWFVFDNSQWKIRRNKLIEVDDRERKLIKVEK